MTYFNSPNAHERGGQRERMGYRVGGLPVDLTGDSVCQASQAPFHLRVDDAGSLVGVQNARDGPISRCDQDGINGC
jgi:hypothetical protein